MTDIANAINYGLPHLINNYYWICSFLFTWIVSLFLFCLASQTHTHCTLHTAHTEYTHESAFMLALVFIMLFLLVFSYHIFVLSPFQ